MPSTEVVEKEKARVRQYRWAGWTMALFPPVRKIHGVCCHKSVDGNISGELSPSALAVIVIVTEEEKETDGELVAATVWESRDKLGNDGQQDLLVFGYSFKLFRENEKALCLDKGKHLIP